MGAAGRCKAVFSTWLSIGHVRIETCTKGQTLSLHFKLLWVALAHRAPSPTDLPVAYAEAHGLLWKQQNQTVQRTKRLLCSLWDWELRNALAAGLRVLASWRGLSFPVLRLDARASVILGGPRRPLLYHSLCAQRAKDREASDAGCCQSCYGEQRRAHKEREDLTDFLRTAFFIPLVWQ